jgi:hypothetical protein
MLVNNCVKQYFVLFVLLDKLPGIVAAVLTAVCCLSIHHIAADIWKFSSVGDAVFALASLALSIHFGRKAHSKGAHAQAPTIATIGRRTQS